MLRTLLFPLLAGLLASSLPLGGFAADAHAELAGQPRAPRHHISVSGTDVGMYPAYSSAVDRYGLTTSDATAGTLTVTATTTDPDGVVLVNGRPARNGIRRVTGLEPGDEIAVFIRDSAGTDRASLMYLPAGFPTLERDTSAGPDAPSPGLVLLTLGLWTTPSPFFETAVDANGVPAYVHATQNSMDLKRLSNGHYSVARGTTVAGGTGSDIVELDERFDEVASYRAKGLTNTDGHDSILLPDGGAYFLSYEPNPDTGLTDAVIQEVGPDGEVAFEWNSKDHVDISAETVVGSNVDYAHVNSIEIMDDGDLLVSFRHFSSIFKIARTAHDGFSVGDVVWKLGGRASDFTFVDEEGRPIGGPCAQHTATQLPNGHILTFDNGAWSLNKLCVDPGDPDGPLVDRLPTRIAEWELDEATHIATLVWSYQDIDRYAIFAGSAQRLPNRNTVVGWASSTVAVASEINEAGERVWDLKAPGVQKYFTYRAFKTAVPDAQEPEVAIGSPTQGGHYEQGTRVTPAAECTDRGGSSLQTCRQPAVDTGTVGVHTYAVRATDGAGNVTTERVSYTVTAPRHQPDALIRTAGRAFIGKHRYYPAVVQRLTATAKGRRGVAHAVVRITNDGTRADRFIVGVTPSSRKFRSALIGAARRSPRLAPGASWTVRLKVSRTAAARPGDERTFWVRVHSVAESPRRDAVALRVRARR